MTPSMPFVECLPMAGADRWDWVPRMRVAADGSALVVQRYQADDLRTFVGNHVGEIGVLVMLLGLAVVASAVRVRRRPRTRGRRYCRRCNHDLGEGAAPGGERRCTECGAVARRGGAPWRPWWWRAAAPLLSGAGTFLVGSQVWSAAVVVDGTPVPTGDERVAWPWSGIVDEIPAWPLWRRREQGPQWTICTLDTLEIYPLRAGTTRTAPSLQVRDVGDDWLLSRDGRHVAWRVVRGGRDGTVDSRTVHWLDLRTGAQRRCEIPNGRVRLHGFTPDDAHLVVTRMLRSVVAGPRGDEPVHAVAIDLVDLASGARREVARVVPEAPLGEDLGRFVRPAPEVSAAVGDPAKNEWALLSICWRPRAGARVASGLPAGERVASAVRQDERGRRDVVQVEPEVMVQAGTMIAHGLRPEGTRWTGDGDVEFAWSVVADRTGDALDIVPRTPALEWRDVEIDPSGPWPTFLRRPRTPTPPAEVAAALSARPRLAQALSSTIRYAIAPDGNRVVLSILHPGDVTVVRSTGTASSSAVTVLVCPVAPGAPDAPFAAP